MMDASIRVPDKCKSCGADIVWCVSERGHPMPLNYPGENRVVLQGKRGNEDLGVVRKTYVSHFATCPQGPAWRRAGESNGKPRPAA